MTATDHPLDDLLEELLPTAAELVVAVRDRDADTISRLVDPLDPLRLRALLIDVAIMVPDDAPFGSLLAWTHSPVVAPEVYAEIVKFDPRTTGKRCTRCQEWWPYDQYHQDPSQPDRHRSRCKSCVSEMRLERIAAKGAA